MPLYHFEVGFPANLNIVPLFNLRPSNHALREAKRDKRGEITLLVHFLPRVAKIIEIEIDSEGEIVKILARQKHDEENDVVFAVSTDNKTIKTAWLQTSSDTHRTLDRSRYSIP